MSRTDIGLGTGILINPLQLPICRVISGKAWQTLGISSYPVVGAGDFGYLGVGSLLTHI